jgi:3-hydroxyacyl-CoA dehydrogenase/enoyl-CoA hydratase/3-hydroxybutyryl-CoA epimerase
LDQPGRAENLLDLESLDRLDGILGEVETDPSISGLVLRSAKPAGFCGGTDMKVILSFQTPTDVERFLEHGWAVLDRLSALAKPTAAVIHGVCSGGGLELALACRRRVALASNVPIQIGVPEVQLGLIPAWGAITQLPQLIGPDDGLDLLITGRSIGFLLARSLGIVDRLASEGDSEEAIDILGPGAVPTRTWPKEEWEAAWNRARELVDQQPGAWPEAQLQILTIVSIDLAHGREAARAATKSAMVELALSDVVRESLTDSLK